MYLKIRLAFSSCTPK